VGQRHQQECDREQDIHPKPDGGKTLDRRGAAGLTPDLLRQKCGQSKPEQDDRRAGHDLIGSQRNRPEGEDQAAHAPDDDSDDQTDDRTSEEPGAGHGGERTHQHEPLECDVGDPRALGEEPTHGGEDER
jgi:hypothetical protein